AVVEAARVLQVVLDLDQLVGELAEIRVGLELRVALLQEQQLLQALAERALVAEALGERSGAGGARAQLGHAREQRLFVGGVGALSEGPAAPIDTVTDSISSLVPAPRRLLPSAAFFGRSSPRTAIR